MGADPATSVVDPDGRVWGWENLYVADASVFPTSLGVNPQVTTMAVALLIGAVAASR
jgi:choline dehydrogenase-like flavoprotein